jgi:menaquinone-specific isochorismate synthase
METSSTSTLSPPESTRLEASRYPAPSSWELARVACDRAAKSGEKTLLVLSFTAPAGDPLAWLSHHHGVPAFYWRSRDGWECAGLGAAHVIAGKGPNVMAKAANEAALFLRQNVVAEKAPSTRSPRFLGGFSFDPLRAMDTKWLSAGFGDAALIMPEALYLRRDTQSYVLFAFDVSARTSPESLIEKLAAFNEHYWHGFQEALPDPVWTLHASLAPNSQRTAWTDTASRLIGRLSAGELEKIVLARSLDLAGTPRSNAALNPWPIVGALRAFDSSCYQFGIQFTEHGAFVGSSPERLFRLDGRRLESEALAGTVLRDDDEIRDRELSDTLLGSVKDQLEHKLVIAALVESLSSLSASGRASATTASQVVKLRTLQHLRSTIGVDLRDEVTVGEVLSALHPTPAVAGVPRDEAMTAIRESETESRGWYSGPVGWIGADTAEFAVGIRSALVGANTARLYAGAGLVNGSVAEREWQEVEDKLQVFLSAVTPTRPSSRT